MKQRRKSKNGALENLSSFQKLVDELYKILSELTDAEFAELEETRRIVSEVVRNHEAKQVSRFELIQVLIAIKKLKIEDEKLALQAQIERLNSL